MNIKCIIKFIAIIFICFNCVAEECPSWRNKISHPQCPLTSLEEFNSYSGISTFSKTKNTKKQKEVMQKAYEDGESWAKACKAVELEKTDPQKSFELYTEFAINNNCEAQTYLAEAYYKGGLFAKKSLEKSYFWLLLSSVDDRKSSHISIKKCDYYVSEYAHSCPKSSIDIKKLEKKLKNVSVESIQDFASNWSVGELPADKFFDDVSLVKSSTVKENTPEKIIEKPNNTISFLEKTNTENKDFKEKWKALSTENFKENSDSIELDATQIFEQSSPAVWTVLAANSKKDIKLGSAVAISKNTLLTNCHVVLSQKNIVIMQGEKIYKVQITSANNKNDTCIIATAMDKLNPVKGFRRYAALKVGEGVFSIGSPKGLEATLGTGIISGLRKKDDIRLIQISAPISSGSSGGGIFDKYGNLIGISTFQLKDSQNMNFSISVDDYFEP